MNLYLKAVLYGLLIWVSSSFMFYDIFLSGLFSLFNVNFDLLGVLNIFLIIGFIVSSISVYYVFKNAKLNWRNYWKIGLIWLGVFLGLDILTYLLDLPVIIEVYLAFGFNFPMYVIVLLLPILRGYIVKDTLKLP